MAASNRRRSVWRFSRRETLFALIVAVVAVWVATVVLVFGTQPLLGGDFIAFYTSGRLVLRGDWTGQYDWSAFHALQVSLVPDSSDYFYPQSYPPLVPALYAPFALLPFVRAVTAWLVFSSVLYSCAIAVAAIAWRQVPRMQIVLAGLLFPPFVAHQVLGQSSVWPMIGFVGGWWALLLGRPMLGGIVLSLVAIKPHLGIALAIVLIAMRQWRVVAGVTLGCTAQAVVSIVVCGATAVTAYVRTTIAVIRNPLLIEASDPRHLHALRTSLDRILPQQVALIGWLVASAVIAWVTVKVWQRSGDWALRFAALLLATMLISPHVQTYDAILLAPAVLWIAQWALANERKHMLLELAVLSVIFLMPRARIGSVPLTIPLMFWVLWEISRSGARGRLVAG